MRYPESVVRQADRAADIAEEKFRQDCGDRHFVWCMVRDAFLEGWAAAIGDLDDGGEDGQR